jgi:hypothetical protein
MNETLQHPPELMKNINNNNQILTRHQERFLRRKRRALKAIFFSRKWEEVCLTTVKTLEAISKVADKENTQNHCG